MNGKGTQQYDTRERQNEHQTQRTSRVSNDQTKQQLVASIALFDDERLADIVSKMLATEWLVSQRLAVLRNSIGSSVDRHRAGELAGVLKQMRAAFAQCHIEC